jgi:hypothetical protein
VTLLLLHAAATLFMTGLVWFVQAVHYPLFARVGEAGFAAYAAAHGARTTWVVGPAMLLEAATAAALVARPPEGVRPSWALAGLALLAVVWLSTFLLQAPEHARLARGFDATAHARLVARNWIRTAAWTARSALALALVAAAR